MRANHIVINISSSINMIFGKRNIPKLKRISTNIKSYFLNYKIRAQLLKLTALILLPVSKCILLINAFSLGKQKLERRLLPLAWDEQLLRL